MQSRAWALSAWIAVGAFGCGGGQRSREAEGTGVQELTFATATVHPSDSEASESPPSGSPLEQAVLHALDARHAAVAQCYATALRQAPDAVGRITVEVLFAPDGHVDRVSGHVEGEGGIGTARMCIESALRGAVVSATSANGLRVHRSYTFVNPPVEITLATPIAVTPPVHAHGHHAAAGSASTESAAPPSNAPDTMTGPLTDDEVSAALSARGPALEECYGAALHSAHTATGAAALTIDVGGGGAVSNVRYESAIPALASASECVSTAIRGTRFRVSGTGATVHANLDFHR